MYDLESSLKAASPSIAEYPLTGLLRCFFRAGYLGFYNRSALRSTRVARSYNYLANLFLSKLPRSDLGAGRVTTCILFTMAALLSQTFILLFSNDLASKYFGGYFSALISFMIAFPRLTQKRRAFHPIRGADIVKLLKVR